MTKNKRISVLAITSALIAATFYAPISFRPLNIFLTKAVEKRLDAKVSCRSVRLYLWRSITADGVKALGKNGFAVSADKASLEYDLLSLFSGRLHVKCSLSDVKFYKGSMVMNSLSDMLNIEPLGNMTFKAAEADLYLGWRDTVTHNLAIKNDNIKISGNALTDIESNINCLLCFSLKDEMTEEMPNEIRESLFRKEAGAWTSVCIGIMGNYKKPMLRIMTDNFRINISS
ncbi:MAG: hypothetical protein ABH875_04545 [Candidatus Omnitrophota bacterium]